MFVLDIQFENIIIDNCSAIFKLRLVSDTLLVDTNGNQDGTPQ